jgi:hypothetical protein
MKRTGIDDMLVIYADEAFGIQQRVNIREVLAGILQHATG